MKKEVVFNVQLKNGVDANKAMQSLEALSDELYVMIMDFGGLRQSNLAGRTNQKTYESVFNTKLQYQTSTVNQSVGRKQKISYWLETQKATVPGSLQDMVEKVYIAKMKHPYKR